MDMLKSSLFFLTTAIASNTAMAGQVYVSVAAYDSSVDGKIENSIDINDKNTTEAFFIGYMADNIIAIEAGHFDLGDFSESVSLMGRPVGEINFDVKVTTLGLVLNAPLQLIDFYAKAGIAYIDIETEFKGERTTDDESEEFAGLGLNINIGNHAEIFAEYLYFDYETEVQSWGLGLRILF